MSVTVQRKHTGVAGNDGIPCWVLRDALNRALREDGMSRSEICRRMGWKTHRSGQPDVGRLGKLVNRPGGHVTYKTAVRFVVACDIDPVDYREWGL